MTKTEKKITILLKGKLELLDEKCVKNFFKEVYEHLIINEKYELCSKLRKKELKYNKILKENKNKEKVHKKKIRI